MRNCKISRSGTFVFGQLREIGRCKDPKWRGLPTLEIAMILTCYQTNGMLADCIERLYTLVRCCRPSGPKCIRWIIQRLSGLAAVMLLEVADVEVHRAVTKELAYHATCFWVGSVWNYGCKLLTENTGYLFWSAISCSLKMIG